MSRISELVKIEEVSVNTDMMVIVDNSDTTTKKVNPIQIVSPAINLANLKLIVSGEGTSFFAYPTTLKNVLLVASNATEVYSGFINLGIVGARDYVFDGSKNIKLYFNGAGTCGGTNENYTYSIYEFDSVL